MNLKEIVSISGKSGLYKVVSKSPKGVVVESLEEAGKRVMINPRFNVAMLEEITIFTNDMSDLHLKDIFQKMAEKDGEKASVGPKASNDDLRKYFSEVAPSHDDERVYPSDIKKIIKWYNLLQEKGYIELVEEEKKEDKPQPEEKEKEVKGSEKKGKKTSKGEK